LLKNLKSGPIKSDHLSLDSKVVGDQLSLNLTNLSTEMESSLNFSMRYYESFQMGDQDSGAYIFKPKYED
jgi:hypothetical protein